MVVDEIGISEQTVFFYALSLIFVLSWQAKYVVNYTRDLANREQSIRL